MSNSQHSYIEIPISNKLSDLGVTKFVKQGDLIQIIFEKHKVVSFNVHPKQLQQTLNRFRESAVNDTAGLSREIVNKVERVLVHSDNGYIPYFQLNSYNNSGGEQENESEFDTKNLNKTYVTVHDDKTSLYEAIIIDNVPIFAKISIDTNKISLCADIQLSHDGDVLFPLPFNLYMSRPYVFKSEKEFYGLVDKVKHETLDTLYHKVKAKWNLYIDQGKEHNIMCAADTIFTYFQDKLGITHYNFFVGGNGTGKTNNLHLFNLLAYRNVLSSDMTAANMYQLLGSGKHGVVTMCEDEADDIDEEREKMKIYKDGVTTSISVLRTDISFGRKQFKYNTFCFKACAAEKLPDVIKAKGFLQRCILYSCRYGNPTYDISEVVEPGGDRKLQQLLDDLFNLRNKLLIYRLLHYHDEIPNVELNIKDREKQLFKSTFRVFQNSGIALEELKVGINKYLSEYRQRRSNTFHAFLYKVVRELIKAEKTFELKSTLIWTRLKDELHGTNIPNKPMSFECEDFGTVTQGNVTKTLREVFGANLKRYGKAGRYLKFYSSSLDKLSKLYDVPTEIKVTSIVSNNVNRRKYTQKKSLLKSRDKQVSVVSEVTPSRSIKETCSKSKNKIIRNNHSHPQRASLASLASPSKNRRKIGKKKVVLKTE